MTAPQMQRPREPEYDPPKIHALQFVRTTIEPALTQFLKAEDAGARAFAYGHLLEVLGWAVVSTSTGYFARGLTARWLEAHASHFAFPDGLAVERERLAQHPVAEALSAGFIDNALAFFDPTERPPFPFASATGLRLAEVFYEMHDAQLLLAAMLVTPDEAWKQLQLDPDRVDEPLVRRALETGAARPLAGALQALEYLEMFDEWQTPFRAADDSDALDSFARNLGGLQRWRLDPDHPQVRQRFTQILDFTRVYVSTLAEIRNDDDTAFMELPEDFDLPTRARHALASWDRGTMLSTKVPLQPMGG